MPNVVYRHQRDLTRAELAAEMRQLGADLHASGELVFGSGAVTERIAVPDRPEWEAEIEQMPAALGSRCISRWTPITPMRPLTRQPIGGPAVVAHCDALGRRVAALPAVEGYWVGRPLVGTGHVAAREARWDAA